ncbi:MAG TPA: glycine oxidase ThiO [Candidatus Acidoferrales bacterium]|nr:glycine oxidase ThiO [Candidatus Acidoferrales bacterium]
METYDTLIVGGGIIGASLAFELARFGQSVLVLDRQEPGHEASWAAAGTISPAPDREATGIAELGCESYRLYPAFISAIETTSGESAGFHPEGAIELFFEPQGEAERDERWKQIRKAGLSAGPLSLAEAYRREPAIGPSARAALWIADEAYLDPRVLTSVTLRAAQCTGVETLSNTEVISVVTRNGKCDGVLGARTETHQAGELRVRTAEKIEARHVVIAAGWRSKEIGGAESWAPSSPVRGQMVAFGSVAGAPRTILRSERGYMAPRENGRIVAGSTLEPGALDKHPTAAGLRKILAAATNMAPALADAPILETWAGIRPDSPDHLPIIGATDVEGLFVATGHYRNGMLLAPVTAKYLAEWIVERRISRYLEPFSPMRFAAAPRSASQ